VGERAGRKPIYSSLADDPELREAIDAFLVALGERVDALQDADRAGELEQLGALGGGLGRDADRLGFEPIAGCAEAVEHACRAGKAEDAHRLLVALTEVCGRARRGYRGAA
jgi:hypothetical protein